jgi:hypothetical protein
LLTEVSKPVKVFASSWGVTAMNSSALVSFLVQQAVWQSPMLLVYVIGIVFCAVRARRAPTAGVLAMAGLGLLLFATVGVTFVQGMAFVQNGAGPSTWRQVLTFAGFGGMLVRAVGTVLLIAAVYAGRPKEFRGGGFEVPGVSGR